MTVTMILLGIWFILAQDNTGRQNILILFWVAWVMSVALWIF